MDVRTSRYHDAYARWQRDPEGFWGEAAQAIDWYEKPKKVLVLPREFSIDAGEITPKLSIKRRVVEDHYSADIEALYAEPHAADHD